MNNIFYLRELVMSLMLTFSTFTLAYASTKEQGQYQEDVEEERYKYDDYERIPSSNTRVVKGVYSTNRGNKELEAQLSFSIDYPHGNSIFDEITRDRISKKIYHYLNSFNDTKSSVFYMPGESAYSMLDYYGVSYLNKINGDIPIYVTDTLGFQTQIEISRIAESRDYVTYREYFYHDNPYYSSMAHASVRESYNTYSKQKYDILTFEDIFKENCYSRVKELLVSKIALAFTERRGSHHDISDVLLSVAELQNVHEIVNATIEGKNIDIPTIELSSFPIASIALIPEGVLFYYPKYFISYGFEGDYTFIIDYDELKDYLSPEVIKNKSLFYNDFSDNMEEDDAICRSALDLIARSDYDTAETLLINSISQCKNDRLIRRERRLLALVQLGRDEYPLALSTYEDMLSGMNEEELLSSNWTEAFHYAFYQCRYGDLEKGKELLKTVRTKTPPRPIVLEDYMGLSLAASIDYSDDIKEKLYYADLGYQIDTSVIGNTLPNRLNYLSRKLKIYQSSITDRANLKEALYVADEMLEILQQNLEALYPFELYGASQLQVYSHNIWDIQKKRTALFAAMNNYNAAIGCLQDGFNQILGKSELEDLYFYDFLSNLYLKADQKEEAIRASDTCYKRLIDYTKRAATSLSLDERNELFDFASSWLLESLPFVVINSEDKEHNGILFNSAMIGKNLKVHIERELSDLLIASNDKDIIQDYVNLRSILRKIDDAVYEDKPTNAIDLLKKQYYEAEKRLSAKSQVFGNYIESFNVTYSDILERLSNKDAAIEFINFKNGEKDCYYALVLTKKLKQPKLIPLFKRDLSMSGRQINIHEALEKVWGPIIKECKGIKHFFFSPSGVLSISPIENCPDVQSKYSFTRLSSCREILVHNNNLSQTHEAALFGGLDYDLDLRGLGSNSTSRIPLSDNEADYIGRGGRNYLSGTLDEVNSIRESLNAHGYKVALYTGNNGTESTLKTLNGKKIQIIHIATHGFYFPLKDVDKRDNSLYIRKVDDTINNEDKDLSRSGLLMSGANWVLNGRASSNPFDDGILSAVEISRLDFSGVDLVVLSACETGLGEINKDGVAGLQRGFKKAGVKTLMVSLWEVDDNATSLLMRSFYEKVVAGIPYREALKIAQDYLREYDNGRYSNYKYWAAFVLLD